MNEQFQEAGRWVQYNTFWDCYAASLSSTAQRVWCAFFRHSYTDGISYVTRQKISTMLGVSTVSVGYGISELKTMGLIEKTPQKNGYKITIPETLTDKKTYLNRKENLSHSTDKKTYLNRKENLSHEIRKLTTIQNNRITERNNTLSHAPERKKFSADFERNGESDPKQNSKSKKDSQNGVKSDEWKQDPKWIKWATNFKNAITSNREISLKCNVSNWAQSFYKLHSIDKIPIEKIKTVLQWYCGELRKGDLIVENSDCVPVALSGDAFRKKFTQIEVNMMRLNKSRSKHIPSNSDTQEKLVSVVNTEDGVRIYMNLAGKVVKRVPFEESDHPRDIERMKQRKIAEKS